MFPGAVTPEVILSSRASYRFAPLLRQDLRMYSTAGTHWLGIRIRVICQLSFWPDGALVLPQRWPDFWLGIWAVSPTPILSFYLIPSVLDPQVIWSVPHGLGSHFPTRETTGPPRCCMVWPAGGATWSNCSCSMTQSLLSTELLQPHPLGSGIITMVFCPWIVTMCLFLCHHHTILTSTTDL